jgi:hypothetical protein
MTYWFRKGAEDVLSELGISLPKEEDVLPEPVLELKKKFWTPSYRPTPFTALFGRYRGTTGGLLRDLKDKMGLE